MSEAPASASTRAVQDTAKFFGARRCALAAVRSVARAAKKLLRALLVIRRDLILAKGLRGGERRSDDGAVTVEIVPPSDHSAALSVGPDDWRKHTARRVTASVVCSLARTRVHPVACAWCKMGTPLPTEVALAGHAAERGGKVFGVFTSPEQRGKGIARLCLACIEEHRRRHGHNYAWLKVGAANVPAIRCYTKCGFAVIARQTRVYLFGQQVLSRVECLPAHSCPSVAGYREVGGR